jgi:hypothetical protein
MLPLDALRLGALLLLTFLSMKAQAPQSPADRNNLLQTITALDASLFDAYNRCDLEKMGALVADDLEFYHDQTGLSVGKTPFLADTKKYICGKVRRDLIPGTLEVYPLKGYGAVELGVHRFHHPGHDDTEAVGEARFVMLWRNQGGAWTLTRVISYDHAAMAK